MPSDPTAPTVLRGATVLAGTTLEPDRRDVVISGGLITGLLASPAVGPPEATAVDCTGTTLLPGFIDAHVHIGFYAPERVLRGGVTTVRDLGWPPHDIFALAARSRTADFAGPRVLAAGQMLTVRDGYPTRAAWAPPGTAREVVSVADAAVAVAEQADLGACIIKIALDPTVGPVLGDSTLRAIVAAAHGRGLRVTAHAHGVGELRRAIASGVDELAHILLGAEPIPDEVIAAMVAADMTVVPTLSCRFEDLDVAVDNLARFLLGGGRVVYGTDLGNEGPTPGIDAREIDAMVHAGMSPHAIVASATTEAASYLGLEDRGVLEPGRVADVLVVDGDPLRNPGALQRVRSVLRHGRVA